jgi:hypothetical protein
MWKLLLILGHFPFMLLIKVLIPLLFILIQFLRFPHRYKIALLCTVFDDWTNLLSLLWSFVAVVACVIFEVLRKPQNNLILIQIILFNLFIYWKLLIGTYLVISIRAWIRFLSWSRLVDNVFCFSSVLIWSWI